MAKQQHARYWLGNLADGLNLADRGSDMGQVLRLTAIKQSIANFVRIVTNKPIPVIFSSGKDSYSNGERVVISGSTDDKDIDAVVGIALHEASEALLRNFKFWVAYVDNSMRMVPQSIFTKADSKFSFPDWRVAEDIKFLMNIIGDRLIDYFIYRTSPGYRPYYESMYDHYFRNRQIDMALQMGIRRDGTVEDYIFYITNMTNKWFDTRHLKGLSRICGIIDLDNIDRIADENDQPAFAYALLQAERKAQTYDLTKMPKIFQMAVEIYDIILDNAVKMPKSPSQSGKGKVGGIQADDPTKEPNMDIPKSTGSSPMPSSEGSDAGENSDDDGDEDGEGTSDKGEQDDDEENKGGSKGSSSTSGESDDDDEQDEGEGNSSDSNSDESQEEGEEKSSPEESRQDKGDETNDESDSTDGKKRIPQHAPEHEPKGNIELNRLRKAIKAQKDFINGQVKKSRVSKDMQQQIQAMEQSGAKVTQVDYVTRAGTGSSYGGKRTAKVLILRKLTKEILESGGYPFTSNYRGRGIQEPGTKADLYVETESADAVRMGVRAGMVLAHRLAIRNQTQIEKFNRKPEGHLDKRRLHALGFEDESVFYVLRQTQFNPVFVHITLDGSGSMSGERWKKALLVGVALCVAAEKIKNLTVVLSVRAGVGEYATIAILYDSRVDRTAKIKSLFPYLCTAGSTPEGLAFAGILEEIINVKSTDRYFINLSDGEPCWSDYGGEPAWRHTREQVNIIRGAGVKVLSYYINESNYSSEAFEIMYGKDASYVDVTKVTSLITTLNKMFLQR